MVLLKENEMQLNSNGATLKTTKQQLIIWMKNIDEYFESQDYSVNTRDLNNNTGSQHTFIVDVYF